MNEAFNFFDTDKTGDITVEQLGRVMRMVLIDPTDIELLDMLNEVDSDGNGTVDIEEFEQLYSRVMKDGSKDQEMEERFSLFDRDGNGSVDREELKTVLRQLGEKLSDEEIDEMFDEID